VATVILAIYYVLPLAENLKDPVTNFGIEVFLIRFSIITPTLFGAIYALSQFSNDRRLYEKYAFKVITISSAETAISTLSRSLEKLKDDDKDIKIIDFAINIFSNMYQEPVEPIHDKWTIKGGNKLLNITAELTQIRKDVDKLVDNKTSSL
jgi:conjugal transfer/entry exclusion protein